MPHGTTVTALIATFTTDGESITVGATPQVSGVTPNDFTSPVTYTVHAADGTTQNYTVTVTVASPAIVQIALPQTGQTPTLPLAATTGMDGFTYFGVPWAYNAANPLVPSTRFSAEPGQPNCIVDNLTGLEWVEAPSATTADWPTALTTASGTMLCGHNDWRLPNRNELVSLVNYGQAYNATWLNTQGFSGVQSDYYWSSTTVTYPFSGSAWRVYMGDGYVYNVTKTNSNYVWPVRSYTNYTTAPALVPQTGQTTSYAANDDGALQKGTAGTTATGRFVVGTQANSSACATGQETVTDKQTGLMWVQAPTATTYAWANAIAKQPISGAAIPAT